MVGRTNTLTDALTNAKASILDMCKWSSTPQGEIYWAEVYHNIEELVEQAKKYKIKNKQRRYEQ